MNLSEIEKQAININKGSESLIEYYKRIIKSLSNLYNIFTVKGIPMAKEISDLIEKYNETIDYLTQNYIENSNQILFYVENSNQNFDNLAKDVENSIKIFDDSQFDSDDI